MGKSDLKIRTKGYVLSVIRLFAELPKRTEADVMGRGVGVQRLRDKADLIAIAHINRKSFDAVGHRCYEPAELEFSSAKTPNGGSDHA